jgi:ADP-ribose pyrophosphatase YjhB (NUDIX family)
MKFCSQCGAAVELRIPKGDSLLRYVCLSCNVVHYSNPKIVVGCIPEWEDKILFCRRAIEPRYGLWTLPAGFLENDESTMQGAARETLEEADARVQMIGLYTLFNLPHINQVYIMFRAKLLDLDFAPGSESLEVELHQENEIPWSDIAFPVIAETLRLYFQDRSTGSFHIHTGDIIRLPEDKRAYKMHLLE